MARNYYAYTCTHCCNQEWCALKHEDVCYALCKDCSDYENNGDSTFENEEEYNEEWDAEDEFYSDEYWEDNPDADDEFDYMADHD